MQRSINYKDVSSSNHLSMPVLHSKFIYRAIGKHMLLTAPTWAPADRRTQTGHLCSDQLKASKYFVDLAKQGLKPEQ